MFQFIQKGAGEAAGWQATCPYHKGTPTAPQCRKFIPAISDSDEHMAAALLIAKAWCVAARDPENDRKYKHSKSPLEPMDEPVLETAVQLLPPPPEEAVPDYVLDGCDEPPRRGSLDVLTSISVFRICMCLGS